MSKMGEPNILACISLGLLPPNIPEMGEPKVGLDSQATYRISYMASILGGHAPLPVFLGRLKLFQEPEDASPRWTQ